MTLNGVTALILIFFSPNLIALQPDYVKVVENRPLMSVKYCFPLPVLHFWPQLTHPAARSLCDSWATCYHLYCMHCLPSLCTCTFVTCDINQSSHWQVRVCAYRRSAIQRPEKRWGQRTHQARTSYVLSSRLSAWTVSSFKPA